MNTLELLDELQKKAMADEKIRKELLLTREQKDPLRAFCQKARALGYELYEMELVDAGENSPVLEGSDDFYELFFASIE